MTHPTPEASWESRFRNQFVREDDGLLNIGKYDKEELLAFIAHERKEAQREIAREILGKVDH